MRDLIGKLEVVDDDTASALRVIDHFDRLVDERTSTAAVVRAAAALAGSPAGLHDASRGLVKRFAADGRALAGEAEGGWHHEPIPGQPGSWLWLERTGGDGPLDALILERAARALQALSTGSSDPSTSGLVRIACDPDATDADRRDAVARLGLSGPVTVVLSTSAHLRATLISTVGAQVVALLPGTPTIPEGVRAGAAVAPDPLQLPAALEQARTASGWLPTSAVSRPRWSATTTSGHLPPSPSGSAPTRPRAWMTYDVWMSCSPGIRGSWTPSTRCSTSRV